MPQYVVQYNRRFASMYVDGDQKHNLKPGKRGKILDFSDGSKRRLRQILFNLDNENFKIYHITITFAEILERWQYKIIFDRFRARYRRRFDYPILIKNEFQKRGAVHAHCIIQVPKDDNIIWNEKEIFCEMWIRPFGELFGYTEEGIRHQIQISGSTRLLKDEKQFMYFCGYVNKDKEAQHDLPDGWESMRWWYYIFKDRFVFLPIRFCMMDHNNYYAMVDKLKKVFEIKIEYDNLTIYGEITDYIKEFKFIVEEVVSCT